MSQTLTYNNKITSFADLLDDNLSQILLMVEKMKCDAYRNKDEESTKQLSIISSHISELYDARLDLAEKIIAAEN